VGKANPPIPVWLFSWAAAIVLVASLVAISTLWRTPQLQREHRRRVIRLPARLELIPNVIGLGLFGVVLYSGFAGAQVPGANFSVTFIYVVFWVGLPVVSVMFGDVFPAFSPWRTSARLMTWRLRTLRVRAPFLEYPRRLGVWPAVGVLIGFGWLELVYLYSNVPSTLAALSLAYFLLMVIGMLAFGVEECGSRADGFGAYFNLVSRLSVVEYRDGYAYWRRPLSGTTDLQIRPGTIALICTIIGTTTFAGASNGASWKDVDSGLGDAFRWLGFSHTAAFELAGSVGLLFCVALIAGIYHCGTAGARSVSNQYTTDQLARSFAHTLVPISFAYTLAYYFSRLIWQGQAMTYLISDPLGNGANLLGTGNWQINYKILSYSAIWYIQVATLLAGHIGGLALTHDRALATYRNATDAVRSQYWMLFMMVAYTSFGLWLLPAVGT
jgi:hypothetical protein